MTKATKLKGLKYLDWYLESTRQDFLAFPFQIQEAQDTIRRIEMLQSNVPKNLSQIYSFAVSNQNNPLPEIADEHRKAAREAARLLKKMNRTVPEIIII